MFEALVMTLAAVTGKPSPAPIAIESCRFVQSASYSRGVRIVFRNTSKLTAKLIIFAVELGNRRTDVVDEGTFTPGETVDHVMTSAGLTLWMGERPSACAVTHVHFADGSTWGD